MRIVFVHRRGPGQFVHLAPRLAAEGWHVTLICEGCDRPLPGVRTLLYRSERAPPARDGASALSRLDQDARVGGRVARALEALRRSEGPPDIVFGHIGWGGLMFARDVLPDTPLIGYCEYFHRSEGGDAGFAPGEALDFEDRLRLRLRNSAQLVTLDALDGGISPMHWQRGRYPAHHQSRIAVCHDGIDTDLCRPADASFTLPNGRVLQPGDPVVTYAARDLEPHRGFPQFMRAAARILQRNAEAVIAVAGADGVSYGRLPGGFGTWREAMMAETGIDPARIVFLGTLPHEALRRLFQVSAAHVYLTYPFVLSWSALEAMACGVLLVGSATPPLEEVVESGRNGLLVPFFDEEALAEAVLDALARREAFSHMRAAARRDIVERYALPRMLAQQTALLRSALRGRQAAASRVGS